MDVIESNNVGGLLQGIFTKIKNAFWQKSEVSELPIDATPTASSDNLVKSGGVKAYVDGAIPDVSGKENTSNKVTSLSSSSSDTQYPSAKCVYDLLGDVETLINAL